MAFPVVVQTRTTTAKSRTVNVSYPTGMTSGNLVVFFLGWVDDAAPVTYTGSKLLTLGGIDNASGNRASVLLWYREVDGTEGTTESFDFDSDKETTAHVVEVSGWDTSVAPLAAYATTNGSKTANPNPPSRAWGWSGDTLALAGFVIRGDEGIDSQPTGYTQVAYDARSGNAGHVISRKNVTTSPEDPSAYTIENAKETTTFTLVIKAASAGTIFNRAAVISSASTLTATSVNSFNRSSAVVSASTVTVSAVRFLNRAAVITSASTVTALGVKSINRAASISSVSSVTALSVKAANRAAVITGASTVAVSGVRTLRRAVVITSTSSVTALGVKSVVLSRAASISSTSTVAVLAVRSFNRTTTISSTSTTTASAIRTLNRAAAIVSASELTALSIKSVNRTASMTSTSSLTAVGQRTFARATTVTGNSTVAALAVRVFNRSAAISSSSTLNAIASGSITRRAASINSVSTISLSYVIISMIGRNLGTSVLVDVEGRGVLVPAATEDATTRVDEENRQLLTAYQDSSYLVYVEQEDRSINVHTRRNAA